MLLKKIIVAAGLAGTLCASASAFACDYPPAPVQVAPPQPVYGVTVEQPYYGAGYGNDYWRRDDWRRHEAWERYRRWRRWEWARHHGYGW